MVLQISKQTRLDRSRLSGKCIPIREIPSAQEGFKSRVTFPYRSSYLLRVRRGSFGLRVELLERANVLHGALVGVLSAIS